jgi:hypothetical protein
VKTTTLLILPPHFFLVALPLASCVATTPTNTGSSSSALSCPEFQPGSTLGANAKVDVRVRGFVQSSADLTGIAATLKSAVKGACVGIDSDLGVTDTWSSLSDAGDSDDAISNANGTGACDAARARIVAIMSAHPNANFALAISRGECHTDFAEEAQCEAGCSSQQKCDPGTVETRCDPAQLSVMCDGSCSSQAFCEGRVDAEANCEGQCEAECTGHCAGTCTDENGHMTDNDDHCHGKCKDHCSGKCNGRCKVEAASGIACGANVSCKGGCTSTYSQPKCETECSPPKCTIDQTCFENCRATVAAKTVCDPPTVKLLADASAGDDVVKLVATIDKNLPPLIHSAEAEGRILVDEVHNLSVSRKAVLDASGDLDFKSVACATAAAESLTKVAGTLDVSTQAAAGVTSDCSSHAN